MTAFKNKILSGDPRTGFLRRAVEYWLGAYRKIVVTRYDVATAKLAPGQTLTIAVVSDIHADTRFMPLARVRDMVAATNALGADLICIGGDLSAQNNWAMTPLALADIVDALSHLTAPLGVFAVLGNHDWWDDPDTQVGGANHPVTAARLRDRQIRVLANEAVQLDHVSGAWLSGLDSQHAFQRPKRQHEGAHDLDKALADVPQDALGILLAHEPDIFPKLSACAPVDLVLSGHTHGGQVRVFGRRPVVPSSYGDRFAYGHMQEAGRDLVVSGGLGCSNIPVRFGVLPEIVFVTLHHDIRRQSTPDLTEPPDGGT